MIMYDKIKKWYMMGLWTQKMVWDAQEKGVLTYEQATKILQEN